MFLFDCIIRYMRPVNLIAQHNSELGFFFSSSWIINVHSVNILKFLHVHFHNMRTQKLQ